MSSAPPIAMPADVQLPVRAVGFSPDGRHAFSASGGESQIAVWRLEAPSSKKSQPSCGLLSLEDPAVQITSSPAPSSAPADTFQVCKTYALQLLMCAGVMGRVSAWHFQVQGGGASALYTSHPLAATTWLVQEAVTLHAIALEYAQADRSSPKRPDRYGRQWYQSVLAGGGCELSRQSIRMEMWADRRWARGVLAQRLHLHRSIHCRNVWPNIDYCSLFMIE